MRMFWDPIKRSVENDLTEGTRSVCFENPFLYYLWNDEYNLYVAAAATKQPPPHDQKPSAHAYLSTYGDY